MICKPTVLKRALENYLRYKPTASEHLRESRERWMPVVVKKRADRKTVCQISEKILAGSFSKSDYKSLRKRYRVAVALCVMQGWSEHLMSLPQKRDFVKHQPLPITKNVGAFLAYIPLRHAVLAIRNWGKERDGGKAPAMWLIQEGLVTKDPNFMQVYLDIRKAWDKRGYDWERRHREEAAPLAVKAHDI